MVHPKVCGGGIKCKLGSSGIASHTGRGCSLVERDTGVNHAGARETDRCGASLRLPGRQEG